MIVIWFDISYHGFFFLHFSDVATIFPTSLLQVKREYVSLYGYSCLFSHCFLILEFDILNNTLLCPPLMTELTFALNPGDLLITSFSSYIILPVLLALSIFSHSLPIRTSLIHRTLNTLPPQETCED